MSTPNNTDPRRDRIRRINSKRPRLTVEVEHAPQPEAHSKLVDILDKIITSTPKQSLGA